MLAVIEGLERSIAHVEVEIQGRLRPVEPTMDRVGQIPGVSLRVLEVLFAEVGWKMDPFPDAAHLACLRWDVPRPKEERRQADGRAGTQGQ